MSSVPEDRVTWWDIPIAFALGVLGVLSVGLEPRAIPVLYLAAVTPILTRTDLLVRRLPNRLVLPGYLVAAVGLAAQWLWSGEPPLIALASGVGYFVFLLVLGLAGGMGMGDVKLAGVLGLAAGLVGPLAAVLSPVAAFVLGGVAGLVTVLRGAGASIPFGPFMLAGFWVAVVLSALSPGGSL